MTPEPADRIDPERLYPLLEAARFIPSRFGYPTRPGTLRQWQRAGRFTGAARQVGGRTVYLISGREILRLIAEQRARYG